MNPSIQTNPNADQEPIMNRGPRITSARDYIRKAHQAFAVNDLNLARENLRAALAFQPEDAELLMALGHVEFGLEHYETALERYTVAADMEPYAVEPISSRALTLQLLQRSKEARVAAEKALELEPADLVSLKVMTRISLDTGAHERARDYCRRILNASPGDQEALLFLDQCRFDLETFLAEDPQAAQQEKTSFSKNDGAEENPWAPFDGPLPSYPIESVLVKFPG